MSRPFLVLYLTVKNISPFHWPSDQTSCMDKGCQNNQPLPVGQLGFVHPWESELLHEDNPKDI